MKKTILLLLMVVLISSVSAMDTTDLVSYYPFQNNANDMISGYNGTASGAYLGAGYYGNGYKFDGDNDYISVASPSYYTNHSNLTICAWTKMNATHIDGASVILSWYSTTAGKQGGFYVKNTAGNMAGNLIHIDGTDDGENGASASFGYQSWGYVCYLINSSAVGLGTKSTVDYYINGTWKDWDDFDGNGTYPSRVLVPKDATGYIGARTSAGYYFNGTLDELVVFKRKLTPTELTYLWTNYTSGGTPINITPPRTEFYFAQNGSDTTGDGSQANPYKTITKLNSLSLTAGNKAYFQCGQLWNTVNDTRPTMTNGNSTNFFELNSYGNCIKDANNFVVNKPRFVATNYTSNSACWDNTGTGDANLWNYTCGIGFDSIGRVVGDVNQNISKKLTSVELIMNTTKSGTIACGQGCFFSNASSNEVMIYSTLNPITYYGNLLLVYDNRMFYSVNAQYINIYNLSIEWTGEHGIDFENDGDFGNIIENDFHDIGGHIQTASTNTRYGNAVQLYRGAANFNISRNRCWETYDACYSAQTTSFAGSASLNNLSFTYNLAWDSAYCGEFFQGDDESNFNDITFAHNTCYRAGLGWYYPQRANTINGRCVRIGGITNTTDFEMYDNLCMAAEEYALGQAFTITDYTGADVTGISGTNSTWYSDYNLWYKNSSASYSLGTTLIRWNGASYTTVNAFSTALLRDKNSKNQSTTFLDVNSYLFNPVSGSEACSMSSTGSYVGALACAGNLPPTISSSTILNTTAYRNTNLIGQCIATDLDGDTLAYSYDWYRNTTLLDINSTLLGVGNFSKGDWITFYCNVTDNINPTVYLNSSVVTILNSRPTKPTISVIDTTTTYNSTDGDGDLITYYIYLNESLFATTTSVSYAFGLTDGSYNSTVEATDGTINSTMSDYVYFGVNGCGNGVIDGTEECDLTNTNGRTCIDFGYNRGTLSCTVLCTFDTSTCENVNVYVDSLYNATSASNSENIVSFISSTNNGVGQTFMSAFLLAFFFVFIMALKRFPLEDVFPAVSFVFFIISIFLRQAQLVTFYLVVLFFFFLGASVAFHFIKGEQ